MDDLKNLKPNSSQNIKPKAYSEEEILNKEHITIDDLKLIAPTDEGNLNLDDSVVYQDVRVTNLLLSTSKIPKNAYVNQIFKIDLKADIQQDINLNLEILIEKTADLKWINNSKITWINEGKGVFKTTLWLEANSTKSKLNKIEIIATRNGEFFQNASIRPKIPTFIDIEKRDNYANIVADELIVKSYKTSKFDDHSNIMTIELNAKNCNLSSFFIDSDEIIKQGINSVRGLYANQSGFYFVVFDQNKTNFEFNYFNAKTKQFENFSLDVNLITDDLSTQTGLSPQDDPFLVYKKFTLFSLVIILLILYILSKNTTPLIFAVFLIGFNIYMKDPHSVGVVYKSSHVKILPMEKSTIFYIPSEDENVQIFGSNKNYYKVMFKNGKIGWVDKSNLEIK
ncbi:SH3 domain-containing protein [Campylobacter blaseri]|uniref:SH3 domain-containing protein n=2 Tax=Campylobacter blaseri TaxID=2042961 RepID=A0A2P8QYW6_9BACT|nr:SH3 domain-containing protein [Campylobacter blaseri]PSM52878.1 SH3 domain-containing protein [Campylobacter blaseri]